MNRLVLFLVLVLSTMVYGQRQAIPPQQMREADVAVTKRTWRVIDLNERQNQVAKWPKNPLSRILYQAALNGQLIPYVDDSLTRIYDLETFTNLGSNTFLVKKLTNPNGTEDEGYTVDTVADLFNPTTKVSRLMIMEEWYFDTRQGQMRAQIIAIAPLYQRTIAGIDAGYMPLCWFKYHDRFNKETDCRDVLVNQLMYNSGNPYQKFSYDDWFEQRNFSSFIIKESNMYDTFLMDDPEVRKDGLEALIKAALLKYQHAQEENDAFEH
ncbi:MAG: gliding motility protein GldN [Bacteroidetes bacterium]|nr:MAG: gliding motility protein GldN [Bacteroidota bacterium]